MSNASSSPTRGRRPFWRKKRYLSLGLVLLLLCAIGAFAVWLVATSAGARWTFERLGGALPGTLDVGSMEGPLRGPLVLRHVRWEQDEGPTVTIEETRIAWQPRDLLRRQVDVHSLRARGIDVHPAPPTEEEKRLPDVNLRFNVLVREARIDDLTIHPAGGDGDPVRIDSIAMDTAALGDDTVEITAFDLRSPDLDLDVAGRLTPRGDYPVDLEVDWALRRSDWPELRGRGSLGETLTELRVDQAIDAPFEARAQGTLLDPLYDLAFRDLRVRFEGFRPQAFVPDSPSMVTAGDVTLQGPPSSLDSRGTVRADTADWGRLRAEYDLSFREDVLDFESLVLDRPDAPTRVRASGTLTFGEPTALDVRLAWRDLPVPPTEEGETALVSPTGEGSLQGTLESWEITATGGLRGSGVPPGSWQLQGVGTETGLRIHRLGGRVLGGTIDGTAQVRWRPDLVWSVDVVGHDVDPLALAEGLPEDFATPGRWVLRGTGDAESMRFDRLEGAALRGRFQGTGTMGWTEHLTWRADLEAEDLEPGVLWEPIQGSLGLSATTSGSLLPAGIEASIAVRELDGALNEVPVSGAGSLIIAKEQYAAEVVDLRWGGATIQAKGVLGGAEGIAFSIRDLPLDRVLEAAGGTLTRAEGRVLGSPEAPRVAASIEADRVVWNDFSAASLVGLVDVGMDPAAPMEADLTARRPVWGDRVGDLLRVRADGTRDLHRLEIALESDTIQASVAAEGTLGDTGWDGTVTSSSLRHPEAGQWALAEPAPLQIATGEVDAGRFCWTSGGASACVRGRWSDDGPVVGDLALTELPLELLEPFFPPDLRALGTLDGEATVRTGEGDLLLGDLRLEPGPGTVLYSATREETIRLTIAEGNLSATAGPEGVEGRLELTVDDGDPVRGRVSLPPYRLGMDPAEISLDGSLEARTDRLAIVSAFVPDLTETEGRLAVDLDFAGTLASPRAAGVARLTEGSAGVPAFGLRLTEVEMTVQGDGDGPLAVEGRARSGPGTLAVSGSLPVGFDRERPMDLHLAGERVFVSDTEEARIIASPDLEVRYDGDLVQVTGQVRVPEADLRIERRPPGALTVSEDVVYVNEVPEAVAAPGLDIEASVRLILGDDVEFEGFGVEATLAGSLLLRDTPERPTTATGEIRTVRGTYEAYGQDLVIDRGRLIFAGPITEPRISVRASRRARDGTVAGIEASGPLRSPEVSLWSEEPMSQSEQLSYVILGRPLRRAGAEEGALLDKAATSLGLAAGGLVAERLGKELGLEQLEISTDRGVEEAELVLGTYLSPRVYIGYGIGVFDAVSTFKIGYLINDKWTLEAQTGRETSGDVLYVVERGHPKPVDETPADLDTPEPEELQPLPVPTEDEEEDGE